ncbi:MAG: M48 family metalloprotease, partial [bacterium]|nr:M48 family metalloprotease [bacterium]
TKRKKISVIFLALTVLGNQSLYAGKERLFSAVMTGARLANLCLANAFVVLVTYAQLKSYYGKREDEKLRQLPDVPQNIQDWARKRLPTGTKNDVFIKIDNSVGYYESRKTAQSQFVFLGPYRVYELRKAFEYQNDPIDYNKCLSRQRIHESGWSFDHEAGHLINNHTFKRIAGFPVVAIGTHFAGKKIMDGAKWLFKIGRPRTIPSFVVQSFGLLAGGCVKCLSNMYITMWGVCRRHEKQADNFANQCAQSAQELDDIEDFWQDQQKKLEKRSGTQDARLRILYALKYDPMHPMSSDRAAAIRKIREEKFGVRQKDA